MKGRLIQRRKEGIKHLKEGEQICFIIPVRVETEDNDDELLGKLVSSSVLLSMLLLREKLGLEGIGSLKTFFKKVDGTDSLPSFLLFVCLCVLFAKVQSSPPLQRPIEYDRFIVHADVG